MESNKTEEFVWSDDLVKELLFVSLRSSDWENLIGKFKKTKQEEYLWNKRCLSFNDVAETICFSNKDSWNNLKDLVKQRLDHHV